MTHSLQLVCPNCQNDLSAVGKNLCCNYCKDEWIIDDDIILSPEFDTNEYWGEISRFNMIHILKRAEVVGPTNALLEWAKTNHYELLAEYGLDWRRSLCFELTGLAENSAVLDYGCGYGTIGLSIAKACQVVYLADSTLERIRFAKLRASELGITNVVPLAIQDWEKLPIPPGSLDVIVINGVLEWVPTTKPGRPLDIQFNFLRSLRELLRPTGKIFIGIENRFALRYFGKYPDDHTQLRYTSLMPRFLANLYCQLRLKQPYRTLTWSLGEHKKYLRKLGFSEPDIYCMFPDYRYPRAAFRVDDDFAVSRFFEEYLSKRMQGSRIKRPIMQLVTTLMLWKWLVYSYGVVVRKSIT